MRAVWPLRNMPIAVWRRWKIQVWILEELAVRGTSLATQRDRRLVCRIRHAFEEARLTHLAARCGMFAKRTAN